jgi:hypothetical protein
MLFYIIVSEEVRARRKWTECGADSQIGNLAPQPFRKDVDTRRRKQLGVHPVVRPPRCQLKAPPLYLPFPDVTTIKSRLYLEWNEVVGWNAVLVGA